MTKLFSDYHNHPLGHDPNRVYDENTLNSWLLKAQERELTDVVFTDHDRYHSGINISNFQRFQDKALEQGVNFRLGIELDNDPNSTKQGYKWTEENYKNLDFVLGSVHFIGNWEFDHPANKAEYTKRDINQVYHDYYKLIQKTAQHELIDGLAHLDLVKIFNYHPTVDISDLLDETLEIIKKNNKTIELSTAGWRKPINEQYPHINIIKKIKELNIPITTASDAHAPSDLGRDYNRLTEIIDLVGITEVAIFENHEYKLVKL